MHRAPPIIYALFAWGVRFSTDIWTLLGFFSQHLDDVYKFLPKFRNISILVSTVLDRHPPVVAYRDIDALLGSLVADGKRPRIHEEGHGVTRLHLLSIRHKPVVQLLQNSSASKGVSY